jgi:hypothetical protein
LGPDASIQELLCLTSLVFDSRDQEEERKSWQDLDSFIGISTSMKIRLSSQMPYLGEKKKPGALEKGISQYEETS